ncbi:phospholipid/cholesterol/gamma-HCH transport system permease protein [Catalinimonas alkaloidigena]|uniref:MlaE family ABC transporter permease n=1 Tax=Catalinimonas alkaloidigena TaxID=1075417 RepID=UPI002404B7CF|nr:ABC transporter permease [Catalinimonas alkaloidigena]MDF9795812.1 phospholipid/cholesterol/gamma-HCH transport system permease protein [Catalinimonas alkaloidigena]
MSRVKDNPSTASEKDKKRDIISYLPKGLQDNFLTAAGLFQFAVNFFKELFRRPYEFKEVLNQAYRLGFGSLLLVGVSSFIMGMVFTLQTRPTLVEFGAESYIPAMVSVAIIREIGPVITAMICAGKVGSGIGAELGSMKVTEQIDAMAVSGTNPFKYVVVTRILAMTIALPILVFYADFVGLIGSFLGANIEGNISLPLYFIESIGAINFIDIFPATVKSFFFGFAIALVGCYKGYTTGKGTVGVGISANSAVVVASLLVFIIDLITVQITQFFN